MTEFTTVVRVDDNLIKLSDTYYDAIQSKPTIVGITSASLGTINPISPLVKLYKNSTITFDPSDSSLFQVYKASEQLIPHFKFNLYVDKNFEKRMGKSENSETFELSRQGIVRQLVLGSNCSLMKILQMSTLL